MCIVEKYLLDPQHPVTVALIGAGGTGSQVLSCLVRIDMALSGLGHPGLHVTVYDPDRVTATTPTTKRCSTGPTSPFLPHYSKH